MVEGSVQPQVIREVLSYTVVPVQAHFESEVHYGTIVGEQIRSTASGCDRGQEHDVVGYTVVDVDFRTQAIRTCRKVDAQIGLGHNFPLKVVVNHSLRTDAVEYSVSEYGRSAHSGGAEDRGRVGRDIIVTEHTPRGPDFQVVKEMLFAHKILFGDVPGQSGRWEDAPLLLVFGRTVRAKGKSSKIPFGIIVSAAGEEGDAVIARAAIACELVTRRTVYEIKRGAVEVRN